MNPRVVSRNAYVTNNPTTFNDPLGLGDATACWTYGGGWEDLPGCESIGASGGGSSGISPADNCSDPSFVAANAECGPFNPAGIPYFPPLGGIGGIGGGVIIIGGASSSGQTPMPAGGALCGLFRCQSGFGFQDEDPFPKNPTDPNDPFRFPKAIKGGVLGWLLTHSPELIAGVSLCVQSHICSPATAKQIYSGAISGTKAVLNDSLGCADAPCIQRALKNIQQQQENGTWAPSAASTVTPNPKNIVPAGAH